MHTELSIVWFRQDLRISDNSAIAEGSKKGSILPIYIFDDCADKPFKIGGASKVWLHNSLQKLDTSLGGNLNLYIGQATDIMQSLIKRHNVKGIFCNTCYEPWHSKQESEVRKICDAMSVNFNAFNDNYLWRPNEIIKDDGSYYKVFTAYKNKSRFVPSRKTIVTQLDSIFIKDCSNNTTVLTLDLLPNLSWHKSIEQSFDIGEVAAKNKLQNFIENHLNGYKEERNYPNKNAISKLSPHLHFGEISASQIIEAVSNRGNLYANQTDIEHFISEVIWREFSCYLLCHFKQLHDKNFNSKFDNFGWENNMHLLALWQKGNSGYPLVDAGMRELWQTGFMHNRVRMVVASFLVKNLNVHWKYGRDWFWDCLVDADLANNSASWQWVAGSGVDAAPYFRIFNPITQGEKFDQGGEYTRKFVPELKYLPNKYLFKPWEAPKNMLKEAGVVLGETYPKPIVDLDFSRKNALELYKLL